MKEESQSKSLAAQLVESFFDRTSIVTFLFKVFRLVVSLVILNMTSAVFKQWYMDNSSAFQRLPTLHDFVFVYFAIEFAVNLIISLGIMYFVDDAISKASLFDYMIGAAISLKLSYGSATVLSSLDRLDYASNGSTLISATKTTITGIVVMNMFIPYYMMVRHIVY